MMHIVKTDLAYIIYPNGDETIEDLYDKFEEIRATGWEGKIYFSPMYQYYPKKIGPDSLALSDECRLK